MSFVLAGIFCYILLQLLIGFIISRKIQSESDYLIAGRKLSLPLLLFSFFATWFGAETCIGSAGAVYHDGLSGAHADPFGYTLCLVLIAFLAVKIWRQKLFTLADFFRQRFSFISERFVAIVIGISSLIWAGAQIRAFGNILTASSGLTLESAIIAATAVVILYTTMGELMADAITDLIQGVVLVTGLIVLCVLVVNNTPGFSDILYDIPLERYHLWHGESFLQTVERWSIPILGSLISQELISRVAGAQSGIRARNAALYAAVLYVTVGSIPVFFGIAGPALLPGLEDGEQLLPLLARQYMPAAGYVLFAGALISAILSTVDSALLSAASLFSHNILIPLFPGQDEKRKLRLTRFVVVAAGLGASILALASENIYHLVEQASAFGGGSILVVFLFGLFTRIGSGFAAEFTLITGSLLWFLLEFILSFPYSFITSIIFSTLLYLTGVFMEFKLLPMVVKNPERSGN